MSHYRPSTGSAAAAEAARPGTESSSNSHGDGGVSFKLKRFLLRYYPPGQNSGAKRNATRVWMRRWRPQDASGWADAIVVGRRLTHFLRVRACLWD